MLHLHFFHGFVARNKSLRHAARFCLPLLTLSLNLACSKSLLSQPTITDHAPSTGNPFGGGGRGSSTPVTCTRAQGHSVYYAGSTIALGFTCSTNISDVELLGAPAYVTAAASGKTVLITGTAPQTASTTSWSFMVNGIVTGGDAAALKTTILTSRPTVTAATDALALTYGTAADLNLTGVALDPSWDGSPSNVSLGFLPGTAQGADVPATYAGSTIVSTDTDLTGLTYATTCASPSGYELCMQATSAKSAASLSGGAELLWHFSPFDQGEYTLKLRPVLTIEGAVLRYPEVVTPVIIGEQPYGNVPLTVTNDLYASGNLNSQIYSYGLAFSSKASTPAKPVLGITYASRATPAGATTDYFARVAVDRSVSAATATPNGVSQANTLNLSAGTSDLSNLVALTDGSWAEVSATNGDLHLRHLADSATAPTVTTDIQLTTVGTTFDSLAVSNPFVDNDGTTRLGVLYIDDNGGNPFYGIGKINPAGTSAAQANDAPAYVVDNGSDFEQSPGVSLDHAQIIAGTARGSKAFYVAFRNGPDLDIGWIAANLSSGTIASSTLPFGALASPFASSATDKQSFSIALGSSAGTQILGAAYRETDVNTPAGCYFRRVNAESMDLSTRNVTLTISATGNTCLNPSVIFSPASGRFVVTYAEQVSGVWQIKSREITLGTTDTLSAAQTIAAVGSNPPLKLQTTFYPAGNWVGVIYREHPTSGSDNLRVHGYHVSPF